MTSNTWTQIILYFVALAVLAKPLGWYMARVFEGKPCCGMDRVFGWLERASIASRALIPRKKWDGANTP